MLKKILTGALVCVMCCTTAIPSFATTVEPQANETQIIIEDSGTYRAVPPVSVICRLENVKATGKPSGSGPWKVGPRATGSSGGNVGKQVTDTFSVTISNSSEITNDVFKSTFGCSLTKGKELTSTCSANVGVGKTVQIYYRALYQTYTADKVMYKVVPGTKTQELSREKITVKIPVDIDFKW
ncbi:MAG: hypothetical protein AB9836_09450 [Aminipila sp.]